MESVDWHLKKSGNPEEFIEILRSERRDILDRLRETRFSLLKNGYPHSQVIPYASYSPWLADELFLNVFSMAKENTMVDIYRCYELYCFAKQMVDVPGAFMEVGVWRGGSAAVLASAAPHKEVHLFDTFNGVAKADHRFDTLYVGGEHADASEHQVMQIFEKMDLKCHIHAGIFPEETLSGLPECISFAHIDVDTYSSAKDAFRAIWARVSPSGMVVFDDYGTFGCEGVSQLVQELAQAFRNAVFIHNLNGHAIFVKKH
ncbi:TylF/MycF/NovP-related O-methyltransferase [Comamonas composti]|uniref:TylF/MycF/NovP-related O-methyltransferase n=1 Tax=Comamonas composti TaxID=408558 RepID=UPI0003FAF37A|nr:TylF/MycF/NovP-related O-methyltransferase [Comamonas composti]